ncbi:MAG: hypothetical protein A2148_07370 [Chloroflexi bacterium RBG_16_68_14]|nr:MAG: hypothetical protein A2148_07370 [Chloroflexi bacterium RBG_16_68_14]
MTTPAEYETALREAERELAQAATAEDVRRIWRKHFGTLGHRALGRLLLGRSAGELLTRRAGRSEGD